MTIQQVTRPNGKAAYIATHGSHTAIVLCARTGNTLAMSGNLNNARQLVLDAQYAAAIAAMAGAA